jgi:translocation and assembly module TamB
VQPGTLLAEVEISKLKPVLFCCCIASVCPQDQSLTLYEDEMTNQPNPGQEPEPSRKPRSRPLLLRRTTVALGTIVVTGVVGGVWWGRMFVYENLAPLVEKNLSESLKRPVQLGRVERFSLNSLQLGASSIPATPNDPDQVTIEAVGVYFDPLKLLFTRKLSLDVRLIKPSAYIEQEKDGLWLSTAISEEEKQGPVRTELQTLKLEDATLVLVPYPKPGNKKLPVRIQQADGTVRFFDRNERITYEATAQSVTGGKFEIAGETLRSQDLTKIELQFQNQLASEVDRLVRLPVNLLSGRLNGNITLQLRPDEKLPLLNGTARFSDITLAIPQVPQRFTNAQGGLQFRDRIIRLDNVRTAYGKIPILANGSFDPQGSFDLTAKMQPVSLATVVDTLNVQLPFPASGRAVADLRVTGPVLRPILSGTARTLGRSRLDKVDLSAASAQFALNTAVSTLAIRNIQATPVVGGTVTGNGTVKLGDRGGIVLDFQARNVPGDALARVYGANLPNNIAIGQVAANAQIFGPPTAIQTVVRWQAPQATYPARGEVVVANGVTLLRNTVLNVAGGTVTARGQAANGRWQGFVQASQVPLNRFSPDLRGALSTVNEVAVSGTLDSFSPSNVRANGNVYFSQGIALVEQPLTAAFRWNGDRILVDNAITPGFNTGAAGVQAEGAIAVRLEGAGAPAITGLDLAVQARGYNLRDLPIALPNNIQLAGAADFVGNLTGTPTAPNVIGSRGRNSLTLRNFALNGNRFESPLIGNLVYKAGQGTDLYVSGRQDVLALRTDANNQPIAFNIRQGENIASGRQQNGALIVDSNSFSLGLLGNLAAGSGVVLPPIAGTVRTQGLRVNLRDQSVVGRIEIDNPLIDPLSRRIAAGENRYSTPKFGTLQGSKFIGDIRYQNGVATLSNGELQQGEIRNGKFEVTSRFLVDGRFTTGADPQITANLTIAEGSRIQDVLRTVQLYDVTDVTALFADPDEPIAEDIDPATLEPTPAGLPDASLNTQLRRLSEVEAILERQRQQRRDAAIPGLNELQGGISGKASIEGSLKTGFDLQADFQGKDWQWGTYKFEQVAINVGEGSQLEGGMISLLPLRFQFDDAVISFSGTAGAGQQSAQLRLENFPIEVLTRFVPPEQLGALPVTVTGDLNATATLSGTLSDPQVIGSVELVDAALSNKRIQSAQGSFSFIDDRLDFGSNVFVEGPEPVRFVGNLPIPLPFTEARPTGEVRLQLDVKNEGLAVLNLFSPQVSWVSGAGQVQLRVDGNLLQPVATGFVQLTDATVAVQALAANDPNDRLLTGINSRATFEGGVIRVQEFRGDYRRGGSVTAQGVVPLLSTGDLKPEDIPLTVALRNIALNLRGLYEGGVNGDIAVTGTAFNPRIGGEIRLADGQILLPDPAATATAGGSGDGAIADQAETEFNNLRLTLGDRIRVTKQPILNFVAQGSLTINGSLNDIRPQGTINLRSGQVNLFTTQFVLERGYPQTAEFVPQQGLDPNLNVRLIASVSEVTRTRLPSETLPSEILDNPTPTSNLGSLQSIRIQARIDDAPASQLADNLELTSSPARTEEEIVSLLGGGFVATLGQGTDSTLGLANLAGSALLTNIQGVIGNTLGLSEFRLFPTLTPSDEARGESTLGLAAEAGIDITRSLSVSVLRILTADQPTQFGLRYRVNDKVRVRSFTDFTRDSGAIVEFETRF